MVQKGPSISHAVSLARRTLHLTTPYTRRQLRSQYLKLVHRNHPDVNEQRNSELYTHRLREINAAYKTLLRHHYTITSPLNRPSGLSSNINEQRTTNYTNFANCVEPDLHIRRKHDTTLRLPWQKNPKVPSSSEYSHIFLYSTPRIFFRRLQQTSMNFINSKIHDLLRNLPKRLFLLILPMRDKPINVYWNSCSYFFHINWQRLIPLYTFFIKKLSTWMQFYVFSKSRGSQQ